jgi:hypothetical protein
MSRSSSWTLHEIRRIRDAGEKGHASRFQSPQNISYLIAGKPPHLPLLLPSNHPTKNAAGYTKSLPWQSWLCIIPRLYHLATRQFNVINRLPQWTVPAIANALWLNEEAQYMRCRCLQPNSRAARCMYRMYPNSGIAIRVRCLVHRYDVHYRGQFAIESFSSWLYQQQQSPWCSRSSRG